MEIVSFYLFLPFFLFLLAGVPIAISLGIACLLFISFSGTNIPLSVVANEMYSGLDQFAFVALPLFILTGELLSRAQITDKLVDVARVTVGWIRGGLAHVNILTSMFFAGISGSALADTASIGPILIPAMIREKFPRGFSAAVTVASSTIGPIIPPSVPMIIVGGQLGISVGGLFAAGILPGILIGLALMIVAYILSVVYNYGERHRFEGTRTIVRKSAGAFPALMAPLVLLGGILSGVFTATEAGAVAVVYTLVVGRFYYRSLPVNEAFSALVNTARITASAVFIVALAVVFSRILTFHQVPQQILELLLAITDNRIILIIIILLFFLVVGTFMDAVANMIILGPLLMPVCVDGFGMHPLQFGTMLVVGLLLGLITPPLGLLLFIAAPIADISIERVAYATLPFFIAEILVLAVIAFVPEVTLFLPRMFGFI